MTIYHIFLICCSLSLQRLCWMLLGNLLCTSPFLGPKASQMRIRTPTDKPSKSSLSLPLVVTFPARHRAASSKIQESILRQSVRPMRHDPLPSCINQSKPTTMVSYSAVTIPLLKWVRLRCSTCCPREFGAPCGPRTLPSLPTRSSPCRRTAHSCVCVPECK